MVYSTSGSTAVWATWTGQDESEQDNLDPLFIHRQRILDLWDRFNQAYPDATPSTRAKGIPTIATLYQAIDQAQEAWQDKQAQGLRPVRDKFFNFAETMNEYSYLFSIIPNGDKYTSLITGVVSSVVKVSANYRKVAEGFSEALSEVSDHLRSVKKISKGSDSHDMRQHVIKLYCEVFELLCHALTWFTSKRKRIGAAFKKNFYDDTVVSLLNRIEKTVTGIDREANYISHGQVREIYERVLDTKLEDRLRSVGIQIRRDGEAAVEGKLGKVRDAIGYPDTATIGLQAAETTDSEFVSFNRVRPAEELDSSDEQPVDESEGETIEEIDIEEGPDNFTRFDIERFASHLGKYRQASKPLGSSARGEQAALLPDEVMLRLKQWIDTPESKTIWIQGIPSTPHNSIVSRAAASVYDVSIQARLPCIAFFCQLSYDFAQGSKLTRKEAGLIALLYTIVSQLVCLLPTEFSATEGLDEKSFDQLDGSMQSIPAALELVKSLLIHVPSPLIWVIDGLQLVEDKVTMPFLQAFLGILQDQKSKGISKLCFTTQGNCALLARGLDFRERADASRTALSRPGVILRGGSDIHQIRGPRVPKG